MFALLHKMTMLTAECAEVIALRMVKASAGGPAAAREALLMMSEKTDAAMRCGPALMAGGSLEAMIDDYRSVVQANAVRLVKH